MKKGKKITILLRHFPEEVYHQALVIGMKDLIKREKAAKKARKQKRR